MRHELARVLLIIACGVLASLVAPRGAAAQFLATEERGEMIVMSTSTSTAVVVGAIMLTVVSVKKEPTAMRRYLRANEPAVRAALTLGGGEVIADLAAFFGLTRRDHRVFAALLRQHRTQLCAAMYDDDDISTFVNVVSTAMSFEPNLRLSSLAAK